MAIRNESPPPDMSEEDCSYDLIDDTPFSKLRFLMLIKKISSKLEVYNEISSNSEFIESEKYEDSDENLELDDSLCKLMDMTVEPGVLRFLSDIPLTEVICEAISVNKSERLNEILIGILANFASNHKLCLEMSNNVNILTLITSSWSSSDTSFLLECARFLKMVLQNSECAPKWLHSIKHNPNFLSHVIFIFQSSINCELLISVMHVVGDLMTRDDELFVKYVCPELLTAVFVARNEADWFVNNDIDYFHYILHLFSTHENGIVSLINSVNLIYSCYNEYFDKICDDEPHLIRISHHHNSLRLVLPTLNVVVSNMTAKEALTVLQYEPIFLDNLFRLIYTCSLQLEETLVQEVYIDISSFFNTVINISHSFLISKSSQDHLEVKWLHSVDVRTCIPQLVAFLDCCTRNDATKSKLMDIATQLNLTYLYEALTSPSIK